MKFILISLFCIIPAIQCLLNGLQSHDGQFPYMAGLMIKKPYLLNCGGAIISTRLIVTTAHCVCYKWSYKYYYALIGSVNLKTGGLLHALDKSICHEEFQPFEYAYDIGMVHTVRPMVFTPQVQYISLQTDPIPANAWVVATGWGCLKKKDFPDELRYTFLQIIPQQRCTEIYWASLEFNFVCTLRTKEEGTCAGDSGGPIMYEGRLAGITFGGSSYSRAPDLYVNISMFTQWIHRQIYLHNRDARGDYISDGVEHDYHHSYGTEHNMIPENYKLHRNHTDYIID